MNSMKKDRKSFTERKSTGDLTDEPNCIGFKATEHMLRLEHILHSYVTDFLKNNLTNLLLQQKIITKPEDYKVEDHIKKIKKKVGADLDIIDVWIDESIIQQKCLKIAEKKINQRKLELEERSKRIKNLALEIARQIREDAFQDAVFEIANVLQTQYVIKIQHDPNLEAIQAKWKETTKRFGLHCQEVDKVYNEEMTNIASWNLHPGHV